MTDALTPLILDFLEWIAARPRPYSEVMDAWRTSCPRLTIWEDAVDRGFVAVTDPAGQELLVDLTPLGHRFLARHGRQLACGAGIPDGPTFRSQFDS
jgi:hypothetical protein